MNDSDFENELRALAPAAPSAALATRIARELSSRPAGVPAAGVIARPTPTRPALGWLRALGWAGAGAAVMLAGVLSFSRPGNGSLPVAVAPAVIEASPVAEEEAFEPTGTSRELVAVNDSGELLETEDGPVREVRYTYVERLAWAHPGTGARLEIEVPREDVYLLPVSLQ